MQSVRFPPVLLTLLVSLIPVYTHAQQSTDETLEEVIVTAQFRDTSLLKSSGSISVVREAALLGRAARHLEETLNVLPNVSFTSAASRARFIQIRGIGDLEQFVDPKYFPSVGVTIDDVDMNGLASAAVMLDIQQVEVLRGPQGTRFGTNALAGMVNIRSNDPTTRLTGYVQTGLGNFNSRNLTAALSGPLGDHLLGRIAVLQNNSDGFIKNDFLKRNDTNDRDEFSLRGKLRWLGADDSHLDLTVFYVDINNGYDAFSLDNNRHTLSDKPGHDQQESLSLAANSYWRLDPEMALETILSYSGSDTFYSYDEDWSNPGICTGSNFCYPFANTDEQHRNRDNFSVDSHLMSVGGARLDWVAGVYFQHRNEDFVRQYYGPFNSNYKSRRYATYTQLSFDLPASWRLVSGLRYEKFEDEYRDSNALISSTGDQYFTGELTLQHELENDTLVYATLSRGVKPGGINTEANSVFDFMDPKFRDFMQQRRRFGKESLWNREIGIKGRYLDNKLSLRAAVFHMDRHHAQLESWIWDDVNFLWVGYLDSVRSATNYGAELELNYHVSPAIDVMAGFGWLQTRVDQITVVDLGAPRQATQSTFRLKRGRDQTKAPHWQYSLGSNIRFTPRLSAQLEVEGRGASFYGYYHDQKIAGYTLLNASLAYQLGNLSIRAWGRNLGNREYAVHGLFFGNDPRKAYINEAYRQLGEPRVYGVDFRYQFH